MKTLITLPALLLLSIFTTTGNTTEPTTNNDIKSQLLDSYLKRCVEVLHSKGYSTDSIKAECTCELDYIDQNFALFEKMLSDTTVTAETQQHINAFKKQLLQCKTEPAAS